MPHPPRPASASAPFRLPAMALLVLTLGGCLPLPIPSDEIPLRTYRDTLCQVDLGYPEGWTFTEKTSYNLEGRVHDLQFEPMRMEWTRRFAVKVVAPDRPLATRTLSHLKEEIMERLRRAQPPPHLDDTAATMLGGEPAFFVRYTTFMNGQPFVRHEDIVGHRGGRDVALSFEVAADHAGADIVLFRKIADRFRFDPP